MREIEEFFHVFYDWLDEKIHEFEDEANKKATIAEQEKKVEQEK